MRKEDAEREKIDEAAEKLALLEAEFDEEVEKQNEKILDANELILECCVEIERSDMPAKCLNRMEARYAHQENRVKDLENEKGDLIATKTKI